VVFQATEAQVLKDASGREQGDALHELERRKLPVAVDVQELEQLPDELRPRWWRGMAEHQL